MAELISPAGTRVSVEGDLVARLKGKGWAESGKPEPKPEPVKRKAPRSKKQG